MSQCQCSHQSPTLPWRHFSPYAGACTCALGPRMDDLRRLVCMCAKYRSERPTARPTILHTVQRSPTLWTTRNDIHPPRSPARYAVQSHAVYSCPSTMPSSNLLSTWPLHLAPSQVSDCTSHVLPLLQYPTASSGLRGSCTYFISYNFKPPQPWCVWLLCVHGGTCIGTQYIPRGTCA